MKEDTLGNWFIERYENQGVGVGGWDRESAEILKGRALWRRRRKNEKAREEEWGDEDITPLDTNNNPPLNVQGPITRARARQLNLEVSSFLNSSSYDYENRLLPNDYIVIRNHGEGQGILGEGVGGMEDQQGHTSQEGGPNQLTSGLFFGSRSSLLENGRPGHIWTRIWVIFIWMES
jgi:hypothetical protein